MGASTTCLQLKSLGGCLVNILVLLWRVGSEGHSAWVTWPVHALVWDIFSGGSRDLPLYGGWRWGFGGFYERIAVAGHSDTCFTGMRMWKALHDVASWTLSQASGSGERLDAVPSSWVGSGLDEAKYRVALMKRAPSQITMSRGEQDWQPINVFIYSITPLTMKR